MLIDWFTVGAQALNFLILAWLLKRFLYKPILKAIDAREKRIAAALAEADAKKAQAQRASELLQQKDQQFEEQRAALLARMTDEVGAERGRLLEDARKAADALAVKRHQSLQRDARDLTEVILQQTQQEVFAIARKALMDLATTELEERMSEVFSRRLRLLDGAARETLAEALAKSTEPARVRSAFELPPAQRAAIQRALNETFSADIPIRFETAAELVSGIELTANGQRVAWTIDDYLATLQKAVEDLLSLRKNAEGGPPPAALPMTQTRAA